MSILKENRGEKATTYCGKIRLFTDLFSETVQTIGQWNDIFEELKEKKKLEFCIQQKNLFRKQDKIKNFLDKNQRIGHQQICTPHVKGSSSG